MYNITTFTVGLCFTALAVIIQLSAAKLKLMAWASMQDELVSACEVDTVW